MAMCVLWGWRVHGNDRDDGGGGGRDGDHGSGHLHDDAPRKIRQHQFRASSHHQHGLHASLPRLLEYMHAAAA